MNKKHLLASLIVLGTSLISAQAIATGLTYDPYEQYYTEIYQEKQSTTQKDVASESVRDNPYADYYNTYYASDNSTANKPQDKVQKLAIDNLVDMDNMADPRNYYQW